MSFSCLMTGYSSFEQGKAQEGLLVLVLLIEAEKFFPA